MHFLLVGATGMLGQDMQQVLQDAGHTFIPWGSKDCDLMDMAAIEEACAALPDLDGIINCAAYTQVDLAEDEKDAAYAVNARAVIALAAQAQQRQIPLLTFSTDYVFAGDKAEGYEEEDFTQPLNVYGASKEQGEKEALRLYPKGVYVARTAWLYGAHGNNFVHTMLELGQKHPKLTVVSDQVGSPTWTKDLAVASLALLAEKKPAGIYHLVNSGHTSWADFTREIFRLRGLSTPVEDVPSSQFPRKAKRPAYSILRNTKTTPLRPWQEALRVYLTEEYTG